MSLMASASIPTAPAFSGPYGGQPDGRQKPVPVLREIHVESVDLLTANIA